MTVLFAAMKSGALRVFARMGYVPTRPVFDGPAPTIVRVPREPNTVVVQADSNTVKVPAT